MGGVIFDMKGNYDMVLIISVVANVAGAVRIARLEPTNKFLVPDYEKERLAEEESQSEAGHVRAATSAGTD